MNSSLRTVLFAGLAVVSLGIAWATHSMNKPLDLAEFSDVGTEFYPEFTDPEQATGLQVAGYNTATGKTDVFKVESRDGLWRIPSHHDYPADGKERLSKTAASMIGVTRKALVERSKSAHKRYDVLDPLDTTVTGTEGRGDRITLYKGDKKIVDLIVGKPLEGESGVYYVRQPDRDPVYTANLGQMDISTKFADWIHADLLEVAQGDVNKLFIDNYRLDEVAGRLVSKEQVDLSRNDNQEWQLADLDPTKETLKTAEITSTLGALSSLKIVGVRKKPSDLIAVLNGEGEGVVTSSLIDMQDKGFFVSRGSILANEGNLELGTSKGVRYGIRFGQEFSGSDVDIEVGQSAKAEPAGDKDDAAKKDAAADEAKSEDDAAKSRYAMITVTFDPTLLGPAPKAPTKPTKPEAAKPAEEKPEPTKDDDTADKPDAATDDAATDETAKEAAPAEAKPETTSEEAYEDALKEYELAQEVYEIQKKQFEADVKSGQKRVDELNRRFADWYYVIGEDVFEKLRLERATLVEPIAAADDAASTPAAGIPGLPGFPGLPGTAPQKPVDGDATKAEMPADKKPAGEEKPVDEKTSTEKPADEKPATEAADGKPEIRPAAPAKPEAEAPKPAPADEKPAAEEPAPATDSPAKPAEESPAPAAEEKSE